MQLSVRDKKFYQTLAAFALPIATQQLITVGVNTADKYYVKNRSVYQGNLVPVPTEKRKMDKKNKECVRSDN
ncbi:MAG: hypothetical protein MR332_05460 [Fusicatenibacter sp.]|nr:hypothetical protein [Fusicatenibacter sp.]